MNILIVDDEIYVVRALNNNIDWDKLGIDTVFTAFNAQRAREILQEQVIDIIITDIEMPKESGLDLMRWIREQGYGCEAICLTCHAEFQYAQQALLLGYNEYCVKPIDFQVFEEKIRKTVIKAKEEEVKKERQKKGDLWENNKSTLATMFWKKLLMERTRISPEKIMQMVEKQHISYDFNDRFLLILFAVRKIYEKGGAWEEDHDLLEYILYNIARDIFLEEEDAEKTGWQDDYMWLILPCGKAEKVSEKLEEFMEICINIAGIGLVAYYDEPCFGEELYFIYQKLKKYNEQNVTVMSGIVNTSPLQNKMNYPNDFSQQFKRLLNENRWEEISKNISEIRRDNRQIDKKTLFLCIHMFQSVVYWYLEDNQMDIGQFWTDQLMKGFTESFQSLEIFINWIEEITERLFEISGEKKSDTEIITKIKGYIQENIEEKISREQIAMHVYVSADYISHIFKREMGISLSEYIMRQKIEKAKQLIQEGEDNIGNIAIRLGYGSFSYFTELFKRQAGIPPSEYKNIARRQNKGKRTE